MEVLHAKSTVNTLMSLFLGSKDPNHFGRVWISLRDSNIIIGLNHPGKLLPDFL